MAVGLTVLYLITRNRRHEFEAEPYMAREPIGGRAMTEAGVE